MKTNHINKMLMNVVLLISVGFVSEVLSKKNSMHTSVAKKQSSKKPSASKTKKSSRTSLAESRTVASTQTDTDSSQTRVITIEGLRQRLYSWPVPLEEVKRAVWPYIQQIADLCKLNHSLPEQVDQLKQALHGLRTMIPLLSDFTNSKSQGGGRLYLGWIDATLFGEDIDFLWERLNEKRRLNMTSHFLQQRNRLYKLPFGSGPESFDKDWEPPVYRGLYCLAHGRHLEADKN